MLFFGVINFLIYYYLVGGLRINRKIIISLIISLIIFLLVQILYLNEFYLINKIFYDLLFYSFLIILNHYSFEALILFFIGSEEKIKDAPVDKKRLVFIINIMRHIIIYLMIFAYQINSIFNI